MQGKEGSEVTQQYTLTGIEKNRGRPKGSTGRGRMMRGSFRNLVVTDVEDSIDSIEV